MCTKWRDAAYSKCAWKGATARLHLRKSSHVVFPSLVKRGIVQVCASKLFAFFPLTFLFPSYCSLLGVVFPLSLYKLDTFNTVLLNTVPYLYVNFVILLPVVSSLIFASSCHTFLYSFFHLQCLILFFLFCMSRCSFCML